MRGSLAAAVRVLTKLTPMTDMRGFVNLCMGVLLGFMLSYLYSDAAQKVCHCNCAVRETPVDWQHIEDEIERIMDNETALENMPEASESAEDMSDMHYEPYNDTMQNRDALVGPVSMHSPEELDHLGGDTVASVLAKRVRILCFVLTIKANLYTRAVHVKNTWTRHCNKIIFVSDTADADFPTIDLMPEIDEETTKIHIWAKIRAALVHVYERYRHQYDWFVRADDDSYWIIENLRYMLMAHSTDEPIWFGCRFKPFTPQGYFSGGVGYVLSREALRRFVQVAVPNRQICTHNDTWAEDAEIAKCLHNVGVVMVDTRDSEARHRILPLSAQAHISRSPVDPNYWFWKYMYYPVEAGMNCCSDMAVAFHYTSTREMYLMEYLIYHLRPYGISTQLVTADGTLIATGSISEDQVLAAVAKKSWADKGPTDHEISDTPESVNDPVPVMT